MDLLVGTAAGVLDLEGRYLLEGTGVSHVTGDTGDWWAATDGGLVRNGQAVASPPSGARLNCVAVAGDRIWVGADSARLFRFSDGELIEDPALADAPGRDTWHTPWGGPPDVRSLAVGSDGVLYVNVHVGGILRRDGEGFTPLVDIHSDVHQVAAHPHQPRAVAAATARGLAVAFDGGSFEFRTEGLEHSYCRAVGLEEETVLVSASRGPRGGASRLYRGSLRGGDLAACGDLPPFDSNLDTHCVLARSDGYFLGHGSSVWVSRDRGETWEEAAGGLPTITSLA
ncbi:MAG: hypothetical protein ACLFWM_09420 [Actinomycetota bacterium]